MSLKVWMPLNGDLRNNGIGDYTIVNNNVTFDSGKLGKGAVFNGDPSQYIHVGEKTDFRYDSNFTYCCWFKCTGATDNIQFIVSNGRDIVDFGGGFNIVLYPEGDNPRLRTNVGNANAVFSISDVFAYNKWIHVAIRVTENMVEAFINGKSYWSETINVAYNYVDAYGLTIGKMSHRYAETAVYFPFKGIVNDVRVYDEVLSNREILEIARGLMFHLPLNQIDKNVNLVSSNYSTSEWVEISYPVNDTYSNQAVQIGTIIKDGYLSAGDKVKISFKVKWEDLVCSDSDSCYPEIQLQLYGNNSYYNNDNGYSVWGSTIAFNAVKKYFTTDSGETTCNYSFTVTEAHLKETYWRVQLRFDNLVSGSVYIKDYKVAIDDASIWTPSYASTDYTKRWLTGIECDVSGNGHTATYLTGTMPVYSTDTPVNKSCYALNRNAIVYFTLTDCEILKENCTISVWGKGYSSSVGMGMLFGFEKLNLYFTGGGSYIYWNIGDSRESPFLTDDGNQVPYDVGVWHMYTVVNTGERIKLYIDGKYVGYAKNYNICFTNNGAIGKWLADDTSDYIWNGKVADFRIYSTDLGDDGVLDLYNSSLSVCNDGSLCCKEYMEDIVGDEMIKEHWIPYGGSINGSFTHETVDEPTSVTGQAIHVTVNSITEDNSGVFFSIGNYANFVEDGEYIISFYVKCPTRTIIKCHHEKNYHNYKYKNPAINGDTYSKVTYYTKYDITNTYAAFCFYGGWSTGDEMWVHSWSCKPIIDTPISVKSSGVLSTNDINEFDECNFSPNMVGLDLNEIIEC